MTANERTLSSLLTFTRDGEWGKGEPTSNHSPAQVVRGTDFERVRSGDLSTLPLRYIRSDVLERKRILPGDTLIETAGGTKDQPTGRSVFVSKTVIEKAKFPLVCASFARFLRPDAEAVIPEFLFWKLQDEYHSRRMMPYHIQHTGVARFQYTQFASTHEFPLPSKDIQARVAGLLGTLDNKIELNRRMNETLEAMARAVFRDWFVDFGPTRRKAAGETDPNAILGGLLPDPARATPLAALFPDSFGEDGLPEGWEERTINDDFDVEMGQSPPGSTYNETGDGLPFFQGRRDFQSRFPEKRVYCTAPTRIAEVDWTLISVRAPVGDINRAWEKCCIGRGVGAMMHKEGWASFTYYVGLHLQTELVSYDKDGTVFGSINQKQLKGLSLIGTNSKAAKGFDELVTPMDALIRNNTEENQALAATRDLLLPKLMSGELRLKDAEGEA